MQLHCFGNSHVWALFGYVSHPHRMQLVDNDLELLGWKLGETGATAYGLPHHGSATGAGDAILRILDEEPGKKDVLMVFGEVDVTDHIGRHGRTEEEELTEALDRYVEYLRGLQAREDVGVVLVASTIPHSAAFGGADRDRIRRLSLAWNRALEAACDAEPDLLYVDWHDCLDGQDGVLDGIVPDFLAKGPADPGERHLSEAARPFLLASIRAALYREDC